MDTARKASLNKAGNTRLPEAGAASPAFPAPAAMEGFTPPASGEHPRLLFRRSDLPSLRARAKTPQGRAILQRLEEVMGGWEVPERVYEGPVFNILPPGFQAMPLGTFTLSHGVGFGLMYQLTGDKAYADKAWTCVERLLEGVSDRDPRYSFDHPGTEFRMGQVLQNMVMAYDHCYDAWPESNRLRLVRAVQELDVKPMVGKPMTLETMVEGNRYPPDSNHFGASVGGTATALLGIVGDLGVDSERVRKLIDRAEERLVDQYQQGWGTRGYYSEGAGAGLVSSNSGFDTLLVALQNVRGHDYTVHERFRWPKLFWIYHAMIDEKGRPVWPHRGAYGSRYLHEEGQMPILSHEGFVAQSFPLFTPEEQRAALWSWERFWEPVEPGRWDASVYPHVAVAAFVHWPLDREPLNPGKVLENPLIDTIHGYLAIRNRWRDVNDVLVTIWGVSGPCGYINRKPGRYHPLLVQGMGQLLEFGAIQKGKVEVLKAEEDILSVSVGNFSVFVDYTGRAGCDAVIIRGRGRYGLKSINQINQSPHALVQTDNIREGDGEMPRFDRGSYTVLTLSADGTHPKLEKRGRSMVIGGLHVSREGNEFIVREATAEERTEERIDAGAYKQAR